MFGLCAVILGEDGMVWNMRIMNDGPLSRKYGYSETASAAAPAKVAEVIALIDARLKRRQTVVQHILLAMLSRLRIFTGRP